MVITVLGTAPTTKKDYQGEVWGLSYNHEEAHILFEVHKPEHCAYKIDYLGQLEQPVYVRQKYFDEYSRKGLKNAAIIPENEIYSAFDRKYLTSSSAWMMAMAILKNPVKIKIRGIVMSIEKEYYLQRPCLEYYIGRAEEAGIEVDIDPESEVMMSTHIYGDDPPIEVDKIVNNIKQKIKERDEVKALMEINNSKLSYITGMIAVMKQYEPGKVEKLQAEYNELYSQVTYQKAVISTLEGAIKTHDYYRRLFLT